MANDFDKFFMDFGTTPEEADDEDSFKRRVIMDKRKMNSIAGWVIEYEIYETYWTIIKDITSNTELIEEYSKMREECGMDRIDCDDISSTREFCDNIFKNITGEDIYEAIGAAYNYHRMTIKQKIERQCERTKIASKVEIKENIRSLTDKEKELAYQEDYIRRVLNGTKNKPFIPLNKRLHWITEDDILEINKIIMDRTKKIYGDRTVSDISPALKKFWDFSAKIEVPDHISKLLEFRDTKVEPKCKIVKTQHKSDAETIKNAIKRIAQVYDDQGCTIITYETTLDNGHRWRVTINKVWYNYPEDEK